MHIVLHLYARAHTHTHFFEEGGILSDRYYSFSLVTYNVNESDIQLLLDKAFKWAWILHDKDKADNHLHVLCTFKQNKSFEVVRKMVKGEQNTFVEPLRDKYKAFQYLTHQNEDEEKASYAESEIHCNDISYFQKGLSKAVNNEEFIIDLLDNNMTDYEKGCKYGRDYIRNIGAYKRFASLIRFEKKIKEKINNGELMELPECENKFVLVKTGEVLEIDCNKEFGE